MRAGPLAFCLLVLLGSAQVQAGNLNLAAIGGGLYRVPVESLKEKKFRTTVRQQYDFSCGSAAVATLLTYQYGMKMSEEAVFQEMYAHGDQEKIRKEGFSLLDIKRFLKARGLEADGFEASLKNLEEARLPAIVLISENGYLHFVVIKGIRQGRVLFSDPSLGDRVLPHERFEQIWQSRLLFVIHNQQQLARFNGPTEWGSVPLAPLQAAIQRGSMLPALRLGEGEF